MLWSMQRSVVLILSRLGECDFEDVPSFATAPRESSPVKSRRLR
jgi:hypothetical protein